MKKIALTFLLCMVVLVCSGQGSRKIYNTIRHFDKFDDELKSEHRKTLVTITDSTIVIEEKGRRPVVYYIMNVVELGSKDSIINLVANVYGYETMWLLLRDDQVPQYNMSYLLSPDILSEDNTKVNDDILSKYYLYAIGRTVTTQYTGTYLDDVFWIQDKENSDRLGKNVYRIIYSN